MRKRLCLMLTLTLLIPVAAMVADANEPSAGAANETAAGVEASEQPTLDPGVIEELLLSAGGNVQVLTLRGQLPSRTPREVAQPCLAGDADLCGFGERLVQARPCLASGDCPAYQTWEQVMGEAGVRPAPESAVRAVALTVPSLGTQSFEPPPLDVQSPEPDERD